MDRTRNQHQAERPPPRTAVRFGSFELQPGRQLLRDGAVIPVGRIVLDLLGALVRARGELVTKDELFEAAWPGLVVVENALHQHMRALRNALGEHSDLIVTVARRGYRFEGHGEEIELGDQDADASGELPSMPAPLTPLIGREDELPAIDRFLAAHRCVTLLGPGGVGKTRLAIEIARRWGGRGAGPAHWVGLAGIAEGDGVEGAIAAAFGLTGPSSLPPLARVRHVLRDNAALIVLDNCEHLVEACAFATHRLMQANAGLHVLATSQHPLGMSGEHRVRVSMLGVPPEGTCDGGVIAASPAVKLLLARVGECASQLHIDSDALEDAAALCRQLDGNALAIELAAVHVATIGLAATRAALADHFRLLAGGPRDVLPRHRSLEAMIDWSCALLDGKQAALFRRLSVFAGGWTLEAAIAAIGDAARDPSDIAGDLSELVERSLIVSEGSTRSPRLRMLE
ncbi:MAG: winged helix-turn-helix domain-containing protein, partial [Rubrivivax sp.]